jgi:hypothetical protein
VAKVRTSAVDYLRTSSAANVGADKDSDKRQRAAIQGFAKRGRFGVVAEYYDPGVSGADPIEGRKGFAEMWDRVENNGMVTVIVEDASRFARELVVQELEIALLAKRGVRLLTASGDDLTDSGDPGRKMMHRRAVARDRRGGQATTAGQPQDGKAPQFPRDQRQVGGCRPPQRARTAVQCPKRACHDRGTATTVATRERLSAPNRTAGQRETGSVSRSQQHERYSQYRNVGLLKAARS